MQGPDIATQQRISTIGQRSRHGFDIRTTKRDAHPTKIDQHLAARLQDVPFGPPAFAGIGAQPERMLTHLFKQGGAQFRRGFPRLDQRRIGQQIGVLAQDHIETHRGIGNVAQLQRPIDPEQLCGEFTPAHLGRYREGLQHLGPFAHRHTGGAQHGRAGAVDRRPLNQHPGHALSIAGLGLRELRGQPCIERTNGQRIRNHGRDDGIILTARAIQRAGGCDNRKDRRSRNSQIAYPDAQTRGGSGRPSHALGV